MFSVPTNQAEFNVVTLLYELTFKERLPLRPDGDINLEAVTEKLNATDLTKRLGNFEFEKRLS